MTIDELNRQTPIKRLPDPCVCPHPSQEKETTREIGFVPRKPLNYRPSEFSKHVMLVEDEVTGKISYMSMGSDGHLGAVGD